MKNSNKVRNMPELALHAVDIVNAVIKHDRRILLFGPMGGKDWRALCGLFGKAQDKLRKLTGPPVSRVRLI